MKYDRNKNHCGQNKTPNQLYLNLTELPAYLSHDLDPRVVILVSEVIYEMFHILNGGFEMK